MHFQQFFRAGFLVLSCSVTLAVAAQEAQDNTSHAQAKPSSTRRTTHASLTPKSASGAAAHRQTVWQPPQASASSAATAPDKAQSGLTGMGSANAEPDSGADVNGSVSALKKPY